MKEDDVDRWKRVATKLGGGTTASVCQEKFRELREQEELQRQDREEEIRRGYPESAE